MDNRTIQGTDFHFPSQTAVYHGKVRDMYTIATDRIVAVATDRISAFDVILPRPIPYKGQVLNQISTHFLQASADVVPNWLISSPDPNVSIGRRCEPFKVEVIVRGILAGSAWRTYQTGSHELCGIPVPDGMQEYDEFPEPIITPTTKADAGHDLDVTAEEIIRSGLATGDEWAQITDYSRKLFARGQQMARERGLFLVDTKYEFGKDADDIYLIDEVHTADSSRYFYADSYEAYSKDRTGNRPEQLSKEFVREWLMARGFSGQEGQAMPDLPDAFVNEVSKRYIELYEQLTGQTFEKPDQSANPLERIEANTKKALEALT